MQKLMEIAGEYGCTITENAPMSAATTFRVGGPADLLIDLPDHQATAAVMAHCAEAGIPRLFIGNGSNLVVGDKGIRGVVLRMESKGALPTLLAGNQIAAPAGISLQRLALFARDKHLTGLEFAHGIPGSLGGAVYMNAGAYDGQMADVILSVTAVTPTGETVELPARELHMAYRHTALMENGLVVTGATLQLTPGDREAIDARMKELMARRREKQPLEYPSAGSFFKRPEGHFAGALIEQAGLKGYTVGGAQISEKHAGFVINRGDATAADIRQLCRDVQEFIWEKNAVRLEPEVRFIGEF